MKILSPGREQTGWAVEVECTGSGNGGGGCGALLLVEQADLYLTYRHCLYETDRFVTFTCAQCQVQTDLNEKQRPPNNIIGSLKETK